MPDWATSFKTTNEKVHQQTLTLVYRCRIAATKPLEVVLAGIDSVALAVLSNVLSDDCERTSSLSLALGVDEES